VALLSVAREVEPSLPVEAAPPRVGELVALLGAAEQQSEVTQGVITAINVPEQLSGEGAVETLSGTIVVRTSVIHGESGGPAIDAAGRVVGVIEGTDDTGGNAVLATISDLPSGATRPPAHPSSIATTTTTSQTRQPRQSAATFIPGDQNPNDATAASCAAANMEIGSEADCAAAQQVAQDLQAGKWSAPGSDTVSKGGQTITFNCSVVGQDKTQAAQPNIYRCASRGDGRDWFEFEFT
jgi:S1-C subfamily serine protease